MREYSVGLMMAACFIAGEPELQFSKDVKVPALQQEDLLSVVLDADVYNATQERFADIRLFDGDGKPVPFFVRKSQTTATRKLRSAWPAKNLAPKLIEGGGLQVTLQLQDTDPQPTGLTLVSPLSNFELSVRVEASADGKTWVPAGKDTLIFDYSRFVDVRSDVVPLPDTNARYFRITINSVTAEQQSELLALTRRLRGDKETERTEQVTVERRPFRIDRIDFWRDIENEQTTGDEKKSYPVTGFRVEPDKTNQQTIIYVDSQRQPLTALELETPDRNFSRHAAVEVERVQGARKSWERIGAATLSRLDFKNLKRESLAISFPEARHARYRIVIDDRDSPPLKVSGVKAEGNVYGVVFLAGPDKQYQLRYGNADAEPANFDLAALQELLRARFQPTSVELASQTAQPVAPVSDFQWKKILNNPLVLGGVATALVALLGWGLFRAVKRIDQQPNQQV